VEEEGRRGEGWTWTPPGDPNPATPLKMFDAGKTRMIGLPYGEKSMTIR